MTRLQCVLAIGVVIVATSPARSQTWRPPTEQARCPSKWGAKDERGSANHLNAERVLRAIQLVKTGQIVELGHVLSPSMPLSGTRRFDVHTKRTVMNPGANRRGSNEEVVVTELGHVGTQLDAFPHQTIGDRLYNCIPLDDVATRSGFTRLGVDKVGALFARGVLIDIAAHKGVEMLPDSYEIDVADLEQALSRQGIRLEPGDAVLVHTGWGRLWTSDPARYAKSAPGLGTAAAEWLAKQDPMLVGADNWPVEVVPNPDPQLSLPVHQIMLAVHGIHLLENLKLDQLAAAKVWEFALMVQPLKIQGGTGSTVAPVAIK